MNSRSLAPTCELCQLAESSPDPVLKSDHWTVIVSFSQKYLGRCLVILRNHRGDLAGLSNEEWLDFAKVTKQLEAAARDVFGAAMFNWSCLMNDAYKKEPAVPHIHWHMRPRYKESAEFADQLFRDESFGHHYDRQEPERASEELQNLIADKLRSSIYS